MMAMAFASVSSSKVGIAAIGSLLASEGMWAFVIFAQDGGATTASTIIPAAALTGTSGALVWVVKQIVSGNLVHRDPAAATSKLAEVLEKSAAAMEKSAEREKILTDMILRDR